MKTRLLSLTLLLCCLNLAPGANPNLQYVRLPDTAPAQVASFRTALADVNHDGKSDLVRLINASQVSVQLGGGTGTFGNPIVLNAGNNPYSVAIADLNNDTHPDIIVCNANDKTMSVFLGNGDGTFQPQIVANTGMVALSIAITDFNRDGKPDVIAAGYLSFPLEGYVLTMTGNGNGTFSNVTTFPATVRTEFTEVQSVAAADLNGDGFPDFVVSAPRSGATVDSFLNNRDGTFSRRAEMVLGLTGQVVLNDFNNDGKVDLAVAITSIQSLGNEAPGVNVKVVMGNGDGTFGTLSCGALCNVQGVVSYGAGPANDTISRQYSSLAARDMDGDGLLDLVFVTEPTSGPAGGYAAILRGSANGTFTYGNRQAVDYQTLWASIGELNGDGALDFVATTNSAITQTYVTIPPAVDLVVTTAADEDNGTPNPSVGAGASLREVLNSANTFVGTRTITFSPSLAGQTINLTTTGNTTNGSSALHVTGDIVIQGLTGSNGITIRRGTSNGMRVFRVAPGGKFTLNDLTVADGDAGNSNGGGVLSWGTLNVNRCTLRNNNSVLGGGAVYVVPGTQATLTNCTIANNTSSFGGAGIMNYGTVTLINDTVTGNRNGNSSGSGGGAYQGNAGSMTMINTIVAGNTQYNFQGDVSSDVSGSLNTGASHHNLIGDGGSGGLVDGVNNNVVGLDPYYIYLGDLASNGGPTKTVALHGKGINAGALVSGVTTDQRGVLRPALGAPDIGAYEYDGPASESLVVTTNEDEQDFSSDPIFGDGTSLREALIYAQSLPGPHTITFAPNRRSMFLELGWNNAADDTALRISGDVTIDGADPNNPVYVIVSGAVQRRHLLAGNGTLQLKNLVFRQGNLPSNGIGGVAYLYGNAQLTNVQCLNNSAGVSGALFITNTANVQITNGYFQGNTATGNGNGGAITNAGGTLTVNDSIFDGNAAHDGGAINSDGSLTIRRTTFKNNTSGFNGGALRLFGTSDIAESAIHNNSASNGGGGLISHGNTTLTNVTIAHNTSQDGGGAQFFEGSGSLCYVTIARNTATGAGGGTAINLANVTAINTMISGNTGANEANLWGAALNAASSNNLLNLSVEAAFLAALANNGGTTDTIALLPGSPAFDAGVAIAGLTTDQRGTARPQSAAVDIGAFELVPSQVAAIPIVGPLGGSYQDSVQVSITSTSARTAVRYTLDGSTPSATNGFLYTAPFNVTQTTTVKAIAYNGGWLPSPIASVGFTVLTPLPFWRNLQGLPGDGSQDMATPAGDGVANLLKYAFNLAPNIGDLSKPNVTILPENGTAGLPYAEIDAQGRLTIEFVRRKASSNPGIAYIVETGSDLNNLMSLSLAGALVAPIDSRWERVTITDPTVSTKRFGRVRIQPLGVYFNDFNTALGAATLRGSASYMNQAVQVTDTLPGQAGAVTFDGITLRPEVTGFTAKFNLQLGPTSTGVPADGASFAVGDLGSGSWGESNPPTSRHLAVGFDTYENGGNGSIGIHLWVNGMHVNASATNPYTNGARVPVEITYQSGTITVKFNGAVIFDNVAASGFSFEATDKFGIGARTGGANERCVVDEVEIAPR